MFPSPSPYSVFIHLLQSLCPYSEFFHLEPEPSSQESRLWQQSKTVEGKAGTTQTKYQQNPVDVKKEQLRRCISLGLDQDIILIMCSFAALSNEEDNRQKRPRPHPFSLTESGCGPKHVHL